MKHLITLSTLIFILSIIPVFASANTQGYAWSESVGYFDFQNAVVSNTNLTGYAYNDNTGWLVLDGVSHTNGTLSGYAWSESVGYFDFSNVSISNGAFTGYAYNDNTGFLVFSDGAVTTTWAPPSTRRSGSSGSIPQNNLITTAIPQLEPTREQLEQTVRTLLLQLVTLLQAQLQALQANQ